jgi:hypothetical protein
VLCYGAKGTTEQVKAAVVVGRASGDGVESMSTFFWLSTSTNESTQDSCPGAGLGRSAGTCWAKPSRAGWLSGFYVMPDGVGTRRQTRQV